jgi:nucleotide sugar dehydrogenase
MKIGVVGIGRLGICFALLLEQAGYSVLASDIRTNYVALLNQRKIQTNEPGVANMLAQSRNLCATTDTREVVSQCDTIYVMVATPSLADGSYDVSAVQRVVDDVKECDFDLTGKILIIGCTTNPGDCQRIQDNLRDRGVHVLYNPEFIAQGSILHDLQHADMVLIGSENQAVMDQYATIYNDIQISQPNVHTMSLTAAELVKIGTNCFLTTKISYANMIGEVLIRSGLEKDVDRALAAIGNDSRVGLKYMRYGFGYGGPCLPRDNRAFAHYAKQIGLDFPLGTIVDTFNQKHTEFLRTHYIQRNIKKLPFYIPSITYKPNTDILEESQQLYLCLGLLESGFRVYIEPNALIPADVVENLTKNYPEQVVFESRSQLEKTNIDFFEINL